MPVGYIHRLAALFARLGAYLLAVYPLALDAHVITPVLVGWCFVKVDQRLPFSTNAALFVFSPILVALLALVLVSVTAAMLALVILRDRLALTAQAAGLSLCHLYPPEYACR